MKPQLKKNTSLDKIVEKFKSRGFNISNDKIRGEVKIKKVRIYESEGSSFLSKKYEVDFIFEGEIYASNPESGKSEWIKSDIVNVPKVSKIKVNKFLRRRLEEKIMDIMELFSVKEVRYYGIIQLKKVIWI